MKRERKQTHYDRLGVPPDADDATIKKAYRKAIKKAHPDHNPDAKPGDAAAVNDAYACLSDPVLRLTYDEAGQTEGADAKHRTMAVAIVKDGLRVAIGAGERDLIKHLTRQIIERKQATMVAADTAKRQILVYEAQKRRARRRGPGTNLILVVLDEAIAGLRTQIEGMQEGLQILDAALELVNDHEFDVDATLGYGRALPSMVLFTG